ncbi:hypothetical protein DBR42_21085 [Pelomonas sp. HMWF004]|nr:hypothetical protein DBR42_21085 [Pelomonas sp. HMWF004]
MQPAARGGTEAPPDRPVRCNTARAALPLGSAVVLAADAHATEYRERTAAEVIADHNAALSALAQEGAPIQVVPAVAIESGAG